MQTNMGLIMQTTIIYSRVWLSVRYDKDGVAIVQWMFLSPQNSYAETLSPNPLKTHMQKP